MTIVFHPFFAPRAFCGRFFKNKNLIRGTVLVFLLCLSFVGTAAAQITIDKVSESFDAKTSTYTYTVVVKNTGQLVADYTITAQPYNDKTQDAQGKPLDSAEKQVKKVDIPGFQKTTFKFTFTGKDGKDWKFKYTDVYDKNNKLVTGDIGQFALLDVFPGSALAALLDFQFPYPNAIAAIDGDPADFFIDVTETSLPSGWVISQFIPAPSQLFTLEFGEAENVSVGIESNQPIFPGDEGFIRFDFVNPEYGFRYNSEVGVRVIPVPEPSSLVLLLTALSLLAFNPAVYKQKRNKTIMKIFFRSLTFLMPDLKGRCEISE